MQLKSNLATIPFLLATGAGVAVGVATDSLAISTAVGSGVGLLLGIAFSRVPGSEASVSGKRTSNEPTDE